MIPPDPATVDRLLREDVPFFDLTTQLLDLSSEPAQMVFRAREAQVMAGLPLAVALVERVGAQVVRAAPSGAAMAVGDELMVVHGTASQLHLVWKVVANLLEAAGGIATRTRRLVEAAGRASQTVEVLATRKVTPGTKELAVEAVLAGGGQLHRLGLSETVLIFAQHTVFLGGLDGLVERLPHLVQRAREKVVLVEVDNIDDAGQVLAAGAGGVQFDKVSAVELARGVASLRALAPGAVLIAAGGISADNAADYAATGVDALVTSWMYRSSGVDVAVRIEPI